MSDEWIWVIAGGILQTWTIKNAQEQGYKVIVSDRNPLAPGMQIADQAILVDTYDHQAHREIATGMLRNSYQRPIAVLTAGADVGPTVSAVAEVLRLKAAPFDVAVNVRNKLKLRSILNASHPLWMESRINDDDNINLRWKARCKSVGCKPYPFVMKPLEMSGSKGVTLVTSPYRIADAMKKIRSINRSATSVLIEEYLEGEEISTDSFVENGKIIFANAAYRTFHTFGIESGHINPYQPPLEVIDIIQRAAIKLGVTEGPFKVDLMKEKNYGWLIMECATRLSGGFDHMKTCPMATGKDVTDAMLDYAIHGSIKKHKLTPTKKNYTAAYWPILKPGIVKKWHIPDGADVIILSEGEIHDVTDCSRRSVAVFSTGKSSEHATESVRTIADSIRVEYA